MKELPHKFQFRHHKFLGHTHSVSLNAHGDYEVKWARGWATVIGVVPNVVFDSDLANELVEEGNWLIADDKPKQEEKLPDEFIVQHRDSDTRYILKKKSEGVWNIYRINGGEANPNAPYTLKHMQGYIKQGIWKLIDKRPITAEQQKTVNTFREQIAQLDSSIKINEQDIEHKLRLISNYEQRQNHLLEKIAEITGEDSPSVVKAKEMKAELAKLKKGNV